MGKFVKRIGILFLIVAAITLLLNQIFVKRFQISPGIAKFNNIPEQLEICNFGSSHGYFGFNYEDVSDRYKCFNFALTEQVLSYDYRLFCEYGNHIVKGTVVFIPVSYFSLWGEEESYNARFEAKNKRYYYILPPELIKDYSLGTDILVRKIPILGESNGRVLKTLLGIPINDEEALRQTATEIDVEQSAEKAYYGHIIKYKFDEEGSRIQNEEEISALYELIAGCKEKGAIPILITTPYLKEYTDKVKSEAPDFYDEFYRMLDKIVKDTGVKYYDYAFDERFWKSYELFRDADHLNSEGAKKFVDVLLEEVIGKN